MQDPKIHKGEILDTIASSALEALRDILPAISREEILKAITDGVVNAMPSADQICIAITDGVKQAFDQEDIAEAISRGVNDATPYGGDILIAIADGVRGARCVREEQE